MIKRLRLHFLGISMTLITVMLLAILGLICRFAWMNLENTAVVTLQTATDLTAKPKPDDKKPGMIQTPWVSYFMLWNNPDGQLEAVGGKRYDLTNTELLQELLEAARDKGKPDGILLKYSLAFCRVADDHEECYAFMDVSTQLDSFRVLIFICAGIGLGAYLLFFGIMWLLGWWMARPVEEAWDRQRKFVADASHELKTPLTVILTNAELLQSEEFDEKAKARFATGIHTMAVQMRGLVEYLLNLARVDHGDVQIHMAKVNLSDLTEEAVLPFEAVYFEAGKTLDSEIEPGIWVTGSGQHLQQVMEILLDNGCKYSDEGTTVTLRLCRQGNHRAMLSVTSHGQTLSKKQCDDIFKRFYRLDAARQMNHSYGLGLAIAHSIVEGHRGRIWCESQDGKTQFCVSLPI